MSKVIYSVNENGVRSEVRTTESKVRPFSVTLSDVESGNTLPSSYHYMSKQAAIAKANQLVGFTG